LKYIHIVKYSTKSFDVNVKTSKKNERIIISVEDKGIGIDD
jgi:signal transduction histidine kinase